MKLGEEYIVHRFRSDAGTGKAAKMGFLKVVKYPH
jgi:hypothetical protein